MSTTLGWRTAPGNCRSSSMWLREVSNGLPGASEGDFWGGYEWGFWGAFKGHNGVAEVLLKGASERRYSYVHCSAVRLISVIAQSPWVEPSLELIPARFSECNPIYQTLDRLTSHDSPLIDNLVCWIDFHIILHTISSVGNKFKILKHNPVFASL